MKKILHYLAIVVLLLCSSQILGQLYPVQVIPQVIPPYTNKLVEYTDGSVNRIQLQLVTTDLTVINRPVYLKMYIEGNGIKAQSRDLIQGTHPLFITGGDMISLSNLELTPYFQLRNLEGISQNTYANPLADGMYHICFEVYDVVTRKRLSQKNCSSMYLVLNDPPMLNLPMDREQVNQTDFTHLLFSWTPRQINALNVSYTFELKEVRDPNLAPSYAFDMAPVLYKEEGIRSTTLLYDLLKPSLVAGKRYAWRVKATSFNGLAENSVFKNNGYSEIRSFSIAVNCGAPTMLLAQDNGRHAVRLTWAGAPTHLKYHVQYRKTGIAGAAWFDRYVVNNQTILTDLEPGFTYEFRVGGTCEPEVYPAQPNYTYSPTAEFTLEQTDNHDQGFSCGLKADTQITNHQPITNLVVNESFYAGDFTVKILDLKGTGSTVYTGVGSIYVPYLGITLAVEFRNIQINTDYQLIHGVVETVCDANRENVHNTNELNPKEEVHQEVDFVIDEITTDSQGNPKVIGTEGEELILEKNKDYTLVDKEGNVWTIASDFDGEESITSPTGEKATSGIPTAANTKGIGKEGEVTAFTAKGVRIYFENASTASYAFDDASGASSSPKYGRLYKQVKGEYLRYKAVVNGEEDKVIARVQFEGEPIALDSLDFKTAAGAAIAFSKLSDREYELTVKGSFNYAEDQIMAVFKPAGEQQYVVAGAMQLIHLNAITLPLRLVPTTSTVNGEQLKQAIIAQYNRVGVTVEAEVLAPYLHGQLAVSEVSRDDKEFLNRYTPSEDRFIAEYFSNHEQEAAFYLFISDQAGGQYGRMPIQSQFGFITDPNGLASMAMTATHELGHGAFELQHPFTQYTTTPGQANSMMDLPPTTDFNQVDWKQMNLRKFSLKTVVQQKEDGVLGGAFDIAPNGKKVYVDAKTIYYHEGVHVPVGTLPGFITTDNVAYYWDATLTTYINAATNEKINTDTSLYKEFASFSDNDVITLHKEMEECKSAFMFVHYKELKELGHLPTDLAVFFEENFDAFSQQRFADAVRKAGITICTSKHTYPKGKSEISEEGQVTESSCKGFLYFTAMSSTDKGVIKQALIKGFNDRKGVSSEDRNLGVFNHIQIIGDKTGAPLDELELIEDRLHLLSYYRPDVYVSVVFLQKDITAFYTVEALNKAAAEIVTEAQLGKKTLLMIVPYGKTLNLQDVCMKLGYGQMNDGDVVEYGDVHIDAQQSWNKNLYKIFAQINKPLVVHRYYRFADETILEVTFPKTQQVKGYPFIKNLAFYESNGLVKLKELDKVWSNYELYGDIYYQKYEEERALDLERYLSLEKTPEGLEDVNLWHAISTEDLGKFREPYFDDKSLTDQLWVDSKESWTWGAKVKIGWQLNGTLLKDRHFYGFSRAQLVDDVVYGATDVVGMIPVADVFADAFGVLYSAARGNYFEASVYSTSLAIPLVGAAYVKGGAKIGEDAAKRIGIIAKKADNTEGFVLGIAPIGDIKAGELQLTSVYLGPNQQLTKEIETSILADIKNYTRNDEIAKGLKELTGNIQVIVSRIDNLPNLSVAERNALKADINESIELKNLFVHNIDKTDELSNAWKTILNARGVNSVLKKDVALLNKVAELKKKNNFMQHIGGNDGLEKIIKNNLQAPCKSCGNSGSKYLKNINEYLDDVDYFVTNFIDISDAQRLLTELKNGAQNTVEGGAFVIRVFKENPDGLFTKGRVAAIDLRFSENVLNRFDVKFVNGFGEFKSYRLENINNISINQLKQYLGATDLSKIDDLYYYFDKQKLLKEYGTGSFNNINEATDAVKEKFKTIFSGSNKEDIFNAIWGNQKLRNSLFESNIIKADAELDFKDLINSTDSKLYKFIKVQ